MDKMTLPLRSADAALKILIVLAVFLIRPAVCQTGCFCSTTGLSDGVEVEKPRCMLRSESATEPTCYAQDSTNCERPVKSLEHPGAALIPCSVSDALFTAAELNDVDSIVRFRELGAQLDVDRNVSYGDFGYKVFSVIEYAAVWGSFDVIEDMIVNDDFDCSDHISLSHRLCRLSSEKHCHEGDERRKAMQGLINSFATRTCDGAVVKITVQTGPDGKLVEQIAQKKVSPGVDAPCTEYTYFASLRTSRDSGYHHICGGALVSKNAVLTAAHCVDGTGGLTVRLLVLNACNNADSDIRSVAAIEVHPDWYTGEKPQALGNGYDLALIKLNAPSRKKPIKLQKKKPKTGDSLNFVGLGKQSALGGYASNLQVGVVSVVDKKECDTAYDTTFSGNFICSDRKVEFCGGDEGGPLIDTTSTKNKLLAIAHLRDPSDICGTSDFPGLYVSVKKSVKWIKKTLKKFSKGS